MEILETKGRKMNKIKREEREDLHTFLDTTIKQQQLSKEWAEISMRLNK
jgi:hypothetical protein